MANDLCIKDDCCVRALGGHRKAWAFWCIWSGLHGAGELFLVANMWKKDACFLNLKLAALLWGAFMLVASLCCILAVTGCVGVGGHPSRSWNAMLAPGAVFWAATLAMGIWSLVTFCVTPDPYEDLCAEEWYKIFFEQWVFSLVCILMSLWCWFNISFPALLECLGELLGD